MNRVSERVHAEAVCEGRLSSASRANAFGSGGFDGEFEIAFWVHVDPGHFNVDTDELT